MSNMPLPEDIVKNSLNHAVEFARVIIPIVRTAVEFVRDEIGNMPHGAVRHPESEMQLAPAFVRCRVHQLIQGHNARCRESGALGLQRRNIRNGAVCLVCEKGEFRLLKSSKRYPTRPSGTYQEGLISQKRYHQLISGDQLPLIDLEKPLLNGLIYYEMKGFELKGAYVVIPNGFINNGVHIVAEQRLEIDDDLTRLATFEGVGALDVLQQESSIVVSEGRLSFFPSEDDPYAQAEPVDYETIDESEGTGETVFDHEYKDPEK